MKSRSVREYFLVEEGAAEGGEGGEGGEGVRGRGCIPTGF